MTDAPIQRGDRVLVWATVREPTNQNEPSGLWWVQVDGRATSVAIHQDQMVRPAND